MTAANAQQRPTWVDRAEAARDYLLGETATRKTCQRLARAYRRLAAWHWIEGQSANDPQAWRAAFIAEQVARRQAQHFQDRADTWRNSNNRRTTPL